MRLLLAALGALWPLPALAAGPTLLGVRQVNSVKALVATAGALLLAAGLLLARQRQPRLARAWDAALLVLGILGAACWWNLFQFNYPMFGHPSETYHYYVGSKYFPELGYTRLYACTALADAEAGLAHDVATRNVRNLKTNTLEPAAPLLEDPEGCRQRFSPERWKSFRADVGWFRQRLPRRRWHLLQVDHGFNATPVWTFFGRLLAGSSPATDTRILALRLLDPLLLVLAGSAVGWTFGWRTLCVALIFWGTSYCAQYGWVGGSYLRQLELCAALVGLCLLRRGRMVGAGIALTLAAGVRIYPALLLAGPGLQALGAMLRERRLFLAPRHRRLLLGVALGAAILLPLSAGSGGGLAAWSAFADNSRVLLGTPLRNHVGLKTLLSHAPGNSAQELEDPALQDPYLPWKRARETTFAGRRALFAVVLAGFVGLLAAAVQRQALWVAVALSAGLVPFALELTSYYAAMLVCLVLLQGERAPVGIALCAFSALCWGLAERLLYFDAIFTWISLAMLATIVFVTLWLWRAPIPPPASAAR